MGKKYVPDGVFLACDKGTCPSTYKVRFHNQTNVYNVPLASELDVTPFLNIKPMGFCMVRGMCIPMPLPWTEVKTDVMINGRLLLEDSKSQCLMGGEISIHFTRESANAVALWGGMKMPTEYIKDGFDWMAEQVEKGRDFRDQYLPDWAKPIAGFSDWVSDFSVGLAEGAINGVVGLGETIYQVAQDPVGTVEALGGMVQKGWDWASDGDNWTDAATSAWDWASDGDNWIQAGKDGAKWIADNPRGIGNGIGEFIPDAVVAVYSGGGSLALSSTKVAGKEILEEGTERLTREALEEGVEKAGKEITEDAAEAGAKKIGREAVEEMMKKTDGEIPLVKTGDNLLDDAAMATANQAKASLDNALKDFDPATATNKQKGNLGEIAAQNNKLNNPALKQNGYDLKRIGDDAPSGLDDKIKKGIDGIYENATPPPKYVIDEAKYGKSTLNPKTADGPQMCDKWVESRLKRQVGDEKAREIMKAMKNGEVDKVLSHADETGKITTSRIDKAGKITGSWP